MASATYELAVQTGGYGLYAAVSVDCAEDGDEVAVEVANPEDSGQHRPRIWNEAAVVGALQASRATGSKVRVTITRVSGTYADTTTAAVAAAAFCAVLRGLGRSVPEPRDVGAWHRRHGFRLTADEDELPSANQLWEILELAR